MLALGQRGELLLQDGNHRYEALVRDGATAVWVFVYSDDRRALQEFELARPRQGGGESASGSSTAGRSSRR